MTDHTPEVEVSTEHASTNFYWTLGKEEVFNVQTTIRGVVSKKQVDTHIESVIAAMKAIVAFGGHAKPVGQQPSIQRANAALEAADTPPDVEPHAAAGEHKDEGVFDASELQATVDGGKAYWKVTGANGKFPKFPVTIWPETMVAAGFDPETLNVLKPVSLAGYKAYFVKNEKGNPQKVVRLVRPQP